jgi:tetratricopeptide (TPR) repeat protein
MRHSLLFALLLALLIVACSQDQDAHALSASGPSTRPTIGDIGCDALPADHDAVYKRGVDLINPYMALHDRTSINDAERTTRLNAGIACLDRALTLVPSNWAALWIRGTAFQALGDHAHAYGSFESAYALHPQNPDVGRELVLECLELGRSAEAVSIADRMVTLAPQDAGLKANLALALILDGQVKQARQVIAIARRQDPDDAISKTLEQRIVQVEEGSRPQPKSIHDLE